uniref:WAP four-disulfide core domain 8 n=1 Tax=Chinchilla lanigera TaxID=34839 RepID=A0A8C2YLT1_CHILA
LPGDLRNSLCTHFVSLSGLCLTPAPLLPHRHLPLHRLAFWRNMTLLMLLFLSVEQTSASYGKKIKQKLGVCPRERLNCTSTQLSLCRKDFDCADSLKCCLFACEAKCMDPYQEPCMLPLQTGNCQENLDRWHFDFEAYECKPFTYSGCSGNANNFLSREHCREACMLVVKKGQCPLFPYDARVHCPSPCKSDIDCLQNTKCCESSCGFIRKIWVVFTGFCPVEKKCPKINRPQCMEDFDCPQEEKCCSSCGLKCMQP